MKTTSRILKGVGLILIACVLCEIQIASAGVCTVDWSNVYQRIDGFGASSAWRSSWNSTLADIFFSTNNGIVYTDNTGLRTTNNGIGLSLLRNHIAYAGNALPASIPSTVETSIMQMAQARGAKVWSTPWTPAAGFKSSADIYDNDQATAGGIDGGSFLGSGNNATNLAYARQLANYVKSMKNSYGINLYAISIQNEPDVDVTSYEACQWTGAQVHDFATNLYNAMLAQNVTSTMIMLPESANWQDYNNLGGPAMNDPAVAAHVGIVADHNYDGADGPDNLSKNSYGKALWETEVSLLSGSDGSITNGVYYAQRVHLFMTAAQANAYHYWWLIAGGNAAGNQGLMDHFGSTTKRLFTFGQFSRFVRPNYYRIDVADANDVLVSAYRDSASPSFAIVAINTNTIAVNETFNLAGFSADTVTPWITSATMSLSNQPPVAVTGGTFTYALPAMSVVTFVNQSTNYTAPEIVKLTASTNLVYGNSVTLAVVAGGAAPLAYQWYDKLGNVISGQTNATLTLATPAVAAEIYTVIITNSQGSTLNSAAVTVTPDVPVLTLTGNINFGQTLASPSLGVLATNANNLALVSGTFGFVTPALAPTNYGPTNVLAYFLPTDTANYTAVTNVLTVEVTGPPDEFVTRAYDDYFPGSIRYAVSFATNNSSVTFDPSLSGATIVLTGGELLPNASLTIDGSTLPNGISLNGNGTSRVFEIASGLSVALNSLTITNGYDSGNGGGGILIDSSANLTLNNCTLAGNSGYGGGIFHAGSLLTVNQCTLAGNFSDYYGAGIFNDGTALTVNQSTLVGNSAGFYGGGILNDFGTVNLINTIVAGNTAGDGGGDIANGSTLTRIGANIIQSYLEFGVSSGPAAINKAPLLAPLGNYGGPTQTMPPLNGSPAIDGCTTVVPGFSTDQRGLPRVIGPFADIGAVEGVYNPVGPGILTGLNLSPNGQASFTFTNFTDMSFIVLASTNLAWPLNLWSNLGPVVESPIGSGQYPFTDPQATNNPQRFYRVRLPE